MSNKSEGLNLSKQYLEKKDIHPIDVVEHLAERHDWASERIADGQISMAVEG